MNRLFRKYHRWMAIVFSLPLITTVVTGMGCTIASEWLHQRQVSRFLLKVHTLEIVAGALQDNDRATLVGTRTFRKVLVQAIQPLEDGSALKLTIAKYYTPKGRDINHIGIAPDITVELTEAQQKALLLNHSVGTLADPQYASAVADLSQLIRTGTNHISYRYSTGV